MRIRWGLAWLATLVAAPLVFVALLFVAAVVNAFLKDNAPDDLRIVPAIVVVAAMYGGAIAAAPTLLLGIPVAFMLERASFTSYVAYAIAGGTAGMVGTACYLGYLDYWSAFGATTPSPKPSMVLPGVGGAYGIIAALLFRSFAGPPPARP